MSEHGNSQDGTTVCDTELAHAQAGFRAFPVNTIQGAPVHVAARSHPRLVKDPIGTLVLRGLLDANTDPDVKTVRWSRARAAAMNQDNMKEPV